MAIDTTGDVLKFNNSYFVGFTSLGTLTVSDGSDLDVSGSLVDNASIIAGRFAGSTGIVNVDGTGSTLDAVGPDSGLLIGQFGTGILNVTNGAQVRSFIFDAGYYGGSRGTVNIDGPGSTIFLTSDTGGGFDGAYYSREAAFGRIGRDSGSKGYLNVTNGGALVIDNEDGVTDVPLFDIARNDGSYGKAIIDGAGSELNIIQTGPTGDPFTANANLRIGRAGQGVLEIHNDGLVSLEGDQVRVFVSETNPFGSSMDQSVDPASRLTIDTGGDLVIDSGNYFGAILDVASGANGRAQVLVDGAGSTISVLGDRGEIRSGNLDGTGIITVSNNADIILSGNDSLFSIGSGNGAGPRIGENQLVITSGGDINITSTGAETGARVVFGDNSDGFGTAEITGNGSTLVITSDLGTQNTSNAPLLQVGRQGTGEITVSNGGQLLNDAENGISLLGQELNSRGTVRVDGNGNNQTLFDAGSFLGIGVDFNFTGGTTLSNVNFTNGGTGDLFVLDNGVVRADLIAVGNNGSIEGNSLIEANIILDGGTGGGNIARLTPGTGTTAGALQINGNLDVEFGHLEFNIFGSSASQHDQIMVNGITNLTEGEITISFQGGFVPTNGQAFSLIQATDLNVVFEDIVFNTPASEDGFGIAVSDSELVYISFGDGSGLTDLSFFENGINITIANGVTTGTSQGFQPINLANLTDIIGSTSRDIFDASASMASVNFNGNSGDDTLTGGSSTDTINGDAGNDTIMASEGFDRIDGGVGTDLFDLSTSTGVNTNWVNLEAAGSQFRVDEGAGFVARGTLTGIENVSDSAGNDRFFGNSEDNSYFYSSGFDTVDGNGGFDTLDISALLNGFQWIDLQASSSQLRSNDGTGFVANGRISDVENFVTTVETDHFRGDGGDQTVVYTGGRDFIDGRAGSDTLDFSEFDNGVFFNLNLAFDQFRFANEAGGFVSGGNMQNVENGIGGDGNDLFFGNAMDNLFFGGLGNDRFDGGAGNDIFEVDGTLADYTLSQAGGTFTLTGISGTDTLIDVEQIRINDTLFDINALDALI